MQGALEGRGMRELRSVDGGHHSRYIFNVSPAEAKAVRSSSRCEKCILSSKNLTLR